MTEAKIIDFKKLSSFIKRNSDEMVNTNSPELKLIFSEKNDIVVKMGRKNEWLSKDEIYITNYRGSIQIDSPFASDYQVFVIKLSSKYIDKLLNRRFSLRGNQKFLLSSIYEEYERGKRYVNGEISNGMIKSLFEQFFLLVFRENLNIERVRKNNKSAEKTIKLVITYLKERIGEDVKFPEIVKKAGLSSTGLKNMFKEYTGMGVMQYFSYLKIEKAKMMLEEGEYNATQIAIILGYESIHYFSRQFKKITGVAPSMYTKEPWLENKYTI